MNVLNKLFNKHKIISNSEIIKKLNFKDYYTILYYKKDRYSNGYCIDECLKQQDVQYLMGCKNIKILHLSLSKLNLPTIKEGLNKGYNYKEDKKRESVIEDIILIKPDIPRRKYRQITEEQLDSLNLILDN